MPRRRGKALDPSLFLADKESALPTGPSGGGGGMSVGRSGGWGRNSGPPQRSEWRSGGSMGGSSQYSSNNGGGSWRSGRGFPTSNRFEPNSGGRDVDTRPAHLRNRFGRGSSGNTQDSRFQKKLTRTFGPHSTGGLQPKSVTRKTAPEIHERKNRKVEVSASVQSVAVVAASEMVSPLETAIEQRTSINTDQLLTAFQRLEIRKTPPKKACKVLANSIVDKKFSTSDLLTAVTTSDDKKNACALLLATCKGIKKKGATAVRVFTADADDTKAVLKLLQDDRTDEEMQKYLTQQDLIFLLPSDPLLDNLISLLASECTPDAVLKMLEEKLVQGDSATRLKPVIVVAILERVFDGKTVSLDVVDTFGSVLARVSSEEPNTAVESEVLFEAQRVWFKAGARRPDIQPLFAKLYECKVVSFEGLCAWRDDRKRGKKHKKPLALLAVNNWITDITPVIEEPDEEDEEEQDEEALAAEEEAAEQEYLRQMRADFA